MAANPLTCTPGDVQAYQPCAQCLSDRELMAVLAVLTGLLRYERLPSTDDLTVYLTEAACWACLTDRQLLEAIVKILHAKVVEKELTTDSIAVLRDLVGCLVCADPKLVKAGIVANICNWVDDIPIVT